MSQLIPEVKVQALRHLCRCSSPLGGGLSDQVGGRWRTVLGRFRHKGLGHYGEVLLL